MGPVRLSIAFVAEWLKPVAFGPVSGFDFLCVFARLYLRRKIFKKKKEVRLNQQGKDTRGTAALGERRACDRRLYLTA